MRVFSKSIFAALTMFAASALPALAQSGPQLQNATVIGALNAQGPTVTGTGCTIAAGSTDFAGKCTTSSTSGSIAFSKTYGVAPFCVVADQSATPVAVYTTTTSQITLTTVTSAHVLSWVCLAPAGS